MALPSCCFSCRCYKGYGKVERSYRKDNEEFYATHRSFSFVDFKL